MRICYISILIEFNETAVDPVIVLWLGGNQIMVELYLDVTAVIQVESGCDVLCLTCAKSLHRHLRFTCHTKMVRENWY
jgi:hypothetical protein